MNQTVFLRLEQLLQAKGVQFHVSRHEPVFTSEEAAAMRGTSLASGAKALILKAGERFVMLVLPADRKLDSRKAQKGLEVKSLRFATKDELLLLTGLEPGAVPPFGSLFHLATYLDPALAANESINFNAGERTISIQMRYADFITVEQPLLIAVT